MRRCGVSILGSRTTRWVREVGFHLIVNSMIGVTMLPRPMRWRALRAVGMDVARSTVGPAVYFGSNRVSIGYGAQISRGAYFDAAGPTVLGLRSSRSMIITGAHELGGAADRVGPPAPVVIGDGVWWGAGVLVLPGVTVGAGCVVAAGASE